MKAQISNISDHTLLETLDKVARLLSSGMELNAELLQIFDLVKHIEGFLDCRILLSKGFEDLELMGASHLSEEDPSDLSRIAQRAVHLGVMQWETLPADSEHLSNESPMESYFVAVPLRVGVQKLGSLCLFCHSRLKDLQRGVREFLSSLSAMLTYRLLCHRNQPQNSPRTEHDMPMIKTSIRGRSDAIRSVFTHISRVSSSDTTVLILGESGVGKELVASSIHENSSRSSKQIIKVNCATLPDSLLESELFGHEKGAFTGATSLKKGRFEIADGGTLFLDEIGEISLSTQVKLLRFLQEKEFERVGGVGTIRSDVRIIAATNRNLESMIDLGEFRLDLFYRLNVFPIHVPALRERTPDIVPIADFFVERYNRILGKSVRRISTPAIDMLVSYHWPGNIRELENCLERAVLLSTDDVIHAHHLPPSLQVAEAKSHRDDSLKTKLESIERDLIADALKSSKGNMARAARELGLTERIMGLRIRKYAIDPKKFR